MYCTRIFKLDQEQDMKNLIHNLSMTGLDFDVIRTKKVNLMATPKNQQYKAVVCWNDVQNSKS